MKKIFIRLLICITIFLMALPVIPVSASEYGVTLTREEIEAMRTKNVFQQEISAFFLGVGDYANNFLRKIFGEDITIDKVVFNRTETLNANFFDNSSNPAASSATVTLKQVINGWYSIFQKLALVFILLSLILAGIKILVQTPDARVTAGERVKQVVMAVVLIFFFPYVMRYAFEINEAIVRYIDNSFGTGGTRIYADVISTQPELGDEELEFRSPKYVSKSTAVISSGSVEATQMYLEQIGQYRASLDLMRIMRAYAGVTLRFVYIIFWYIMLAQTYILVIMYLKRYLMIAFLIIIYPLVIIGYVVGGMFGNRQTAFNKWSKTFFTNIFTQTIHAVIYGVITSVLVKQLRDQLSQPGQGLNFFLMIMATSFLFQGEKLLAKFWKASIDTSERKGLRGMFKGPKAMWGYMQGKK